MPRSSQSSHVCVVDMQQDLLNVGVLAHSFTERIVRIRTCRTRANMTIFGFWLAHVRI